MNIKELIKEGEELFSPEIMEIRKLELLIQLAEHLDSGAVEVLEDMREDALIELQGFGTK